MMSKTHGRGLALLIILSMLMITESNRILQTVSQSMTGMTFEQKRDFMIKKLRERREQLLSRTVLTNKPNNPQPAARVPSRVLPVRRPQTRPKRIQPSRAIYCKPTLYYIPILKVATEANHDFVKRTCLCPDGDCAQCLEKKTCHVANGTGQQICYSFIRDPLSRFFSQYAEMSERAVKYFEWAPNPGCAGCIGPGEPKCRPARLTHQTRAMFGKKLPLKKCCCDGYKPITKSGLWVTNTTEETRMLQMIEDIKQRGFFDSHMYPQSDTFRVLTNKTDSFKRLDKNYKLQSAIRYGNCKKLDKLYFLNNSEAAYQDLKTIIQGRAVQMKKTHSRAAMPKETLAHYYMNTKSISPEGLDRIKTSVCELYFEDYCRFDFVIPEVCLESITESKCLDAGYSKADVLNTFY
eukprot:m.159331 g.159331  ORF g.159331 m.159331 type:complete len:407 (+) comp15147_c0_seq1:178-1398(+)